MTFGVRSVCVLGIELVRMTDVSDDGIATPIERLALAKACDPVTDDPLLAWVLIDVAIVLLGVSL